MTEGFMRIRSLNIIDILLLEAGFKAQGWHKPTSLFEAYAQENAAGTRTVLVAFWGTLLRGM
ncbi:MAG: hypothetical protein H2057_05785 [Alphaproteobacteria bacterium]|nr:hypothetical protein [Alphaproteobacteria bacterium]